jgi:CheY-like chemotaxis protein
MITGLFVKVHMLAAGAEDARQHTIALTAAALEILLKKLLQNVKHFSGSALQTVSMTVALIRDLCARESAPDLAMAPPIHVLVVDDDPVALRAISHALQRTLPKPESASDGKSALARVAERRFDMIFLDVQMPDLDGFEVCRRIRETSANGLTPVVFLTSTDAAGLRVKSEICGGNDFLTKPCLGSELTLKALVSSVRGRLENSVLASGPTP